MSFVRVLFLIAMTVSPLFSAEQAPRPRSSNVKLDSAFDPPAVMVPRSGFAVYVPPAEVRAVEYVALDGEEAFPVQQVGGSPTAFVFFARGLPEKSYRFVGIASDSAGNLTRKNFAVQVGKPEPKTPPVTSDTFYFVVIRADGPATSQFTKIMADPAWSQLRKDGHRVKDKTVSEATAIGVTLPSDVSPPAVVTLVEDASTSRIVRQAIALPTTTATILDLPKGVK